MELHGASDQAMEPSQARSMQAWIRMTNKALQTDKAWINYFQTNERTNSLQRCLLQPQTGETGTSPRIGVTGGGSTVVGPVEPISRVATRFNPLCHQAMRPLMLHVPELCGRYMLMYRFESRERPRRVRNCNALTSDPRPGGWLAIQSQTGHQSTSGRGSCTTLRELLLHGCKARRQASCPSVSPYAGRVVRVAGQPATVSIEINRPPGRLSAVASRPSCERTRLRVICFHDHVVRLPA